MIPSTETGARKWEFPRSMKTWDENISWLLSSSRRPIQDANEENKFQDSIVVAFPICNMCNENIRRKSSPSYCNDPTDTKSMYPKEATIPRVLDEELLLGHECYEHRNWVIVRRWQKPGGIFPILDLQRKIWAMCVHTQYTLKYFLNFSIWWRYQPNK